MLASMEHRLPVTLAGLGPDEVAALVTALRPESVGDTVAQRLYADTGGHPLYLRTLLSEGSGFDSRSPERLALPRSLAAAVGDQLRGLPPETRTILEMLAVLNLRMPLAQLGPAAQVSSPSATIEPAVAAGLVDWWPEEPVCPVQIRHQLVREAIYARITATQRRLLHSRAAIVVSENASWEHRVAALEEPDEDLAAQLERLAAKEAAVGRQALGGHPLAVGFRHFPGAGRPRAAAADRRPASVTGRRIPVRCPAGSGGGDGAITTTRLRAGHHGLLGLRAGRSGTLVHRSVRAGA